MADGIYGAAIKDLRGGLARTRLWRFLAWRGLQKQYDRTVLGILWIPANVLLIIILLGFVMGRVFGNDVDYMAYFGAGWATWTVVAQTVTSSVGLWPSTRQYVQHLAVPRSVFLFEAIARAGFTFLLSIPVGFLLAALFGHLPDVTTLLVIPGGLVYFANLAWMVVILSLFGARYRDVARFIPNTLVFVYLATPILWRADTLRGDAFVAELNPAYHLVELVRAPILNASPSSLSWTVGIAMAVVGNLIALGVFARARRRVVLWV